MTSTINAYTRGTARYSGIRAYEHMADTWGVPVDDLTTQAYKDAAAKAKAFKQFRAEQTAPDPLDFILDNEPAKWSAGLNKIATAHAAAEFTEDNFARVNAALDQRAENMLHDDAALAHVAGVLDIDTAQQQVLDAAAALGQKLYEPQQAAITSPQHFAAYMEGIARIVALDAALRSRSDRAAMYADVPPLPSMKFERDGLGKRTNHYTRDDVNRHQKAHDWSRDAVRDDVAITKLAVGEYAPLTLNITLDPAVLDKRAARLAGAGATEQI